MFSCQSYKKPEKKCVYKIEMEFLKESNDDKFLDFENYTIIPLKENEKYNDTNSKTSFQTKKKIQFCDFVKVYK